MNKSYFLVPILFLSIVPAFGAGFDSLSPANPLSPQLNQENTIALPIKKATLTHNDIHNQYAIAFNRFMQSNVKSAYGDFRMLIRTMSSNDYAYMKLSEYMADIGFFKLSEEAFSLVEDKSVSEFLTGDIKLYYFPSKQLRDDDEIYLGEVFSNIIYNDQSREATAELIKNTELMQNSDYANYIAALGYLKSNEFIDAEKYIDTAIKMNSQNLNYKKLKAEIQSQGKNPKSALKTLNYIKSQNLYSADFTRKVNSLEQYVLYKSKKNYSEKMYHLGYYYYYENELVKSVRTLQNALSAKKKLNKDVYALLSRVYFDSNDFEKAQDSAQKALRIDDNNAIALLVTGDLSYREKDYKSALKYYKSAESSVRNSSIASIKVAQTYEQLGKVKKAYDIYDKILKTYNDCYLAYYKVALNDKSKELAYLKKAISINIDFVDAWIDLGRVAIEKQDYLNAKKYLKIANSIDENNYRYYYYQGMLAKKQGQDGVPYFKKSLLINPDYEDAKKELNI